MSGNGGAGGRPSDYREEYVEKIIEYFDQPLYVMKKKQIASGGRKVIVEEERPNSMPTFEGFAGKIKVTHKTLLNWCKDNPEFLQAYEHCKDIQKKFIMEHGMMGNYNPGFAKFIAVNVTDLKDKVTHEVEDTRIVVELPSDKAAKL